MWNISSKSEGGGSSGGIPAPGKDSWVVMSFNGIGSWQHAMFGINFFLSGIG